MQITPESFRQTFQSLGLAPESAAPIVSSLKSVDVAAGEHVIDHGARADTLYFVASGRLRMTAWAGDSELELGTVAAGRWFGEFGFIDPGEASVTVVAERPGTLLALSHDAMEKLFGVQPDAASDLLQRLSLDLARRLRETSRQQLVRDDEHHFELQESAPADRPAATGLGARIRMLLGASEEAR